MNTRTAQLVVVLAMLAACGGQARDSGPATGGFSGGGITAGEDPSAGPTGDGDGDGDSSGGDGDATSAGSGGGDGDGDGEGDGDGDGDVRFDVEGGAESNGGMDPPGGDCDIVLDAIVRDILQAHPDFEAGIFESDPGIVADELGWDNNPVYAGNPDTPTTTGQGAFDTWWNDVQDVNESFDIQIPLTDEGNGLHVYDSTAFFPIDDMGFGNEGNPHNYHFTLEMHTTFPYRGGETFFFRGDDDLFVFINGKLAMDLGGVHRPEEAFVDLDAQAADLGINPGGTYSLDFFFAERHTEMSNFRIETTIECFGPPAG